MNSLQLTLYRDEETARANKANEELKAQANYLTSQYNAELKRNNEVLAGLKSRELDLKEIQEAHRREESVVGLKSSIVGTAYDRAVKESKFVTPFLDTIGTVIGYGIGTALGSPILGVAMGAAAGSLLSKASVTNRAAQIVNKVTGDSEFSHFKIEDGGFKITSSPLFENVNVDW